MRIAYLHGSTLAVAAPDGQESRDLVIGCVDSPAWSPDGASLVYSCRDSTASELYVVGSTGGTPINITHTPGVHEEAPSWSPDGTQIVFEVNDPNGGLFTIHPDGSNRQQLTFEASDEGATWSPDGTRIAFLRWFGPTRPVYSMAKDGSDVVTITGDPTASNMYTNYSPSWSPNGATIAFTRFLGPSYDVFRIQVDGTGLRQLTNGGTWTDAHWTR
jgi:TolB protein